MNWLFHSRLTAIANLASYLLAVVRASITIPIEDETADDCCSNARATKADIGSVSGETGAAYCQSRCRTKHPGYTTSNGLGSLEVGGADD